jgi:hypothetical protein
MRHHAPFLDLAHFEPRLQPKLLDAALAALASAASASVCRPDRYSQSLLRSSGYAIASAARASEANKSSCALVTIGSDDARSQLSADRATRRRADACSWLARRHGSVSSCRLPRRRLEGGQKRDRRTLLRFTCLIA